VVWATGVGLIIHIAIIIGATIYRYLNQNQRRMNEKQCQKYRDEIKDIESNIATFERKLEAMNAQNILVKDQNQPQLEIVASSTVSPIKNSHYSNKSILWRHSPKASSKNLPPVRTSQLKMNDLSS
jgi:hypothetical protein